MPTIGLTTGDPADRPYETHKKMKTNKQRPQRKSIRLRHYDYTQPGFYFVTICTQSRECLFGQVVDGQMVLNDVGQVVRQSWAELPQRYPTVELDASVIMPNHVHGIIVIGGAARNPPPVGALLAAPLVRVKGTGAASSAPTPVSPMGAASSAPTPVSSIGAASSAPTPVIGAASGAPTKPTLGQIIRAFKSISAIQGNRILSRSGRPLWQRNYYEHVIRNDDELQRAREYIGNNPMKWEFDGENPNRNPSA